MAILLRDNYNVRADSFVSAGNRQEIEMKTSKRHKRDGKTAMSEKMEPSGGARPAAKPKIISVKAGMKYRGAREAWYNMLQQFEGKTVGEFVEAAKEKPPSRTKKDEAEPPMGWVRFFERTGVLKEVAA